MSSSNVKNFWRGRWVELNTPWDIGDAHPYLDELLDKTDLKKPASIYVPGCGRAHDAAALAQKGFEVLAEDIVPEAIEEAKKLYSKVPNLAFSVKNIFEKEEDTFEAIFDRAVWCALPPSLHEPYIAKCCSLLKPNGYFLSVPFLKLKVGDEDGPPYAINESKIRTYLSKTFRILSFEKKIKPPKEGAVVEEQAVLVAQRISK